jgi:hypothetical protein
MNRDRLRHSSLRSFIVTVFAAPAQRVVVPKNWTGHFTLIKRPVFGVHYTFLYKVELKFPLDVIM